MKKLILIKLGGSCITDKSTLHTFDEVAVCAILQQFKWAFVEDDVHFILAHGAGSFGHILAKKYDLKNGLKAPEQVLPTAQVHHDVATLQAYIVELGLELGLPLFRLHTASHFTKDSDVHMFEEPIFALLERGFIPVLHGDTIVDAQQGIAIFSADTIVTMLAKAAVKRYAVHIVHVGDYDGVLNAKGEVIRHIKADEVLPDEVFYDPAHPDITGGMRQKVLEAQEAARAGILVSIVNGRKPEIVLKTLQGSFDDGSHVQL